MADTRTLMLRLDAETEAARAKLGALGSTTDTLAQRYAKLVTEARQLDVQQEILKNTTGATSAQFTDLSARLQRVTAGFKEVAAEARQATGAVDNFGDKAARKSRKADSDSDDGEFTKGKAAVAGAVAGAVAAIGSFGIDLLKDAASQAVEFATSLSDVSQQLGVSTDFLQDFRFGASQTGATMAEADTALTRFVQTTGKAADGNKTAAASFKGLGVDIADVDGKLKPTETLYREVADAIAALPDPQRQASEAMKFFGVGAAALLPLLKSGSQGLDTFAAAASTLGLKLSALDIATVDALANKAAAVKQVLTVQMASAIGQNADAIVGLGEAAGQAVGRLGKLLQSFQGMRELVAREGAGTLITSSFERQVAFATVEGRANVLKGEADKLTAKRKAAEAARDKGGIFNELFNGGSQPNIAQLKNEERVARARSTAANLELSAKRLGDTVKTVVPGLNSGGDVKEPVDKAAASAAKAAARKAEAERKRLAKEAEREAERSRKVLDSAPRATPDDTAKAFEKSINDSQASEKRIAAALGPLANLEIPASVKAGMKEIADEAERAKDAAGQFTSDLSFGLADAIINGGNIGDVLVDSFKRAAVEALASGIFKLLTSAVGGPLSSGFAKILGFADGGDPPIGRVSLVGERGPELFVPKVAGTIISNGKFGFGGGGGGNTTTVVNVDARGGSDPAEIDRRVQAGVMRLAPGLYAGAKAGITAEARRPRMGGGRG